MQAFTVLKVHQILDNQTVQNYPKFHILNKYENHDNRFLVPDLDLKIFFAYFESLINRQKIFSFENL